MSAYYEWHSRIYDCTRWAFLFDRAAILEDLHLKAGETVIEVGCGTGHNLDAILNRVGPQGEVLAVDCSAPMIKRCRKRIRDNDWTNVRLIDREYGSVPISSGQADAVVMSYSLSMIPYWEEALEGALRDLRPGGRIGVLDFYLENRTAITMGFSEWMARNHVMLDRPYLENLSSVFRPIRCVTRKAFGGLWSFYRFVGKRA